MIEKIASEDGKNAHSALCTAIVNSNCGAAFKDSQWHFDATDGGGRTEARLHGLANALAIMSVLDNDYDDVHLVVASRQGFDPIVARRRLDETVENRFQSQFAFPGIPTRFPAMDIDFTSAKQPGIQVCDFVLWAVQRADPSESKVAGELKVVAIGVCNRRLLTWLTLANHWLYVHAMVATGKWAVTFTPGDS